MRFNYLTEVVQALESGLTPDIIEFNNEYYTLTDVTEIADRFDYYIVPSGYINITRLSKVNTNNFIQVARNNQDIEEFLK